jgi:hypothetical protein
MNRAKRRQAVRRAAEDRQAARRIRNLQIAEALQRQADPEPQTPLPIHRAEDMILAYPGMTLDQATTLLGEADQAAEGDPAETLGVFLREERDPFTRALIRGQRLKVARLAEGPYQVTVTDEAGE